MQNQRDGSGGDEEVDQEVADAMGQLERQARAPAGFVAASEGLKGNTASQPVEVANPDAINLDEIDE